MSFPLRLRPRVKARRQPFMVTALLQSKLQAFGLSLNRLDRGPKPGGSFLQGGRCRRHLNQLPIFCIGKARALTRHLYCSPRLQPPVLQGDGRIRKTNSPPHCRDVDAFCGGRHLCSPSSILAWVALRVRRRGAYLRSGLTILWEPGDLLPGQVPARQVRQWCPGALTVPHSRRPKAWCP